MKAKVFIKKSHDDQYRVGFTVGVQTFHLDMGSEGLRPKEEAKWYRGVLANALTKLSVSQAKAPNAALLRAAKRYFTELGQRDKKQGTKSGQKKKA